MSRRDKQVGQEAQVRVAGPSRGVLALSTGALVVVTSAATAFVVLTGTGSVVRPTPSLEPLPPAAAPPGGPPVVVLPPGALGLPSPEQRDASTSVGAVTAGSGTTTPFVLAAPPASVGLRALLPAVTAPVAAPAAPGAVLPGAGGEPPTAAPVRPSDDSAPKAIRKLARTVERELRRAGSSDQPTGEVLDFLGPKPTDALRTQTAHQWDEQDERALRHAPPVDPAVPALPAAVTGSRAIPALPASAAASAPRPAAAQAPRPAAASAGKPAPGQASKAKPAKAKASAKPKANAKPKAKANAKGDPKGKAKRSSAGHSSGKKKKAPARRSGGPRP